MLQSVLVKVLSIKEAFYNKTPKVFETYRVGRIQAVTAPLVCLSTG